MAQQAYTVRYDMRSMSGTLITRSIVCDSRDAAQAEGRLLLQTGASRVAMAQGRHGSLVWDEDHADWIEVRP